MREVRSLYSRNLRITGAMACYGYGSCSRFADLNDHFIIYYNVNPGWINHGLWIRGYPPNSHFRWYINIHKWYGTLPIKQPRGLLIQGWHYHVYCSRVIGLQELTDWDAHPSEVLVEGGLKKLFILDKVFRSPKKKQKHTPLTIQVFSKYWTGQNPKKITALAAWCHWAKKKQQVLTQPAPLPTFLESFSDRSPLWSPQIDPGFASSSKAEVWSSEVWGSQNFCHGLMVLNGL